MVMQHRRSEILLATALAVVAGFVDAIGFSNLGGFFVAFMSGNTTRAGVSLVHGDFREFGLASGLIASFVVGVVGGSIVGHLSGRWRRQSVIALVALMLAVAAVTHTIPATEMVAAPLIAAAMGTENAIFERNGEVSIGLTYMTGTLVKLGQHVAQRLLRKPGTAWTRYLALWAGLTFGTVSGAAAYVQLKFNSIWIAVLLLVVMACVSGFRRLGWNTPSGGTDYSKP